MNWPQHQFKFISKNGKKLARNKSKKINRKRLSGLSAGQIYYPRHRRCKKSITSSINRSNAPITSSCKINVHKRNPWKGMRIPSFFLPSFLRPSIPRPHPFSSSFFFFLSQNATSTIPSIDFSRVLARKREREETNVSRFLARELFFQRRHGKGYSNIDAFHSSSLSHPLVLPLFFHTPFPFVAAISATVLTDLAFSFPDFCKSPDNLSPRAVRLRAKPRSRFFAEDGEMDGRCFKIFHGYERSLLPALETVRGITNHIKFFLRVIL